MRPRRRCSIFRAAGASSGISSAPVTTAATAPRPMLRATRRASGSRRLRSGRRRSIASSARNAAVATKNVTRGPRFASSMAMSSKHIDRQRRATELSRELRQDTTPDLRRPRRIAGLSLIASASMGVLALYQTGPINQLPQAATTRHPPEPPLPFLDADRVDASAEAYAKFDTPDAVLGLASYGVTAVLAAMGGKDRASTAPWVVLALAGKVAFDALNALKLSIDQPVKYRAFCFWCLIAASATFASVPQVIPEVRKAIR